MAKPLMCDPSLFKKDLSKQVYIVTGANSGIGLVTAQQLAKQNGQVVFACRRTEEAEKEIAQLAAQGLPKANMRALSLDLGDLSSVRSFVKEFLSHYDQLHGLVNNAGVMNTPLSRTKDGFEMQFGINHCGHFLLSHLLLDTLKKSSPARIVNVSSCFHDKAMGKTGFIHFDDLNFEKASYNGWEAYAQSKLANLLHAKELAKRLQGTDVIAVSVHPGWVRTNLAKHSMPLWVQNIILKPIFRLMGMIEPWEGAQTTLHCLLADDIKQHNGAYFSQTGTYRNPRLNKGGWPLTSPNEHANDQGAAAKLYEETARLVGAST
ncbi:SDR family oxidoreductase [Pseudobacteriovorax antillogorgiicola]|uniref:Retinol dehydrogenase-12 n=1 Tax=Pseudobacteriovorax antillogorgiicola TaxID=1513793 RepID=A0A1Y6CM87_9BACT|nr:SDR family oxidoreductase [Pseudobacteriovorax antillogorgiicola]TCS46920.1 retinol dehydrogenase-12 [Pseudobacteriovorax antillogorgiicola]SMF64183.1 retinol dehydrogenase-12 [Pseudobacteriovorax antillogorgiicola]